MRNQFSRFSLLCVALVFISVTLTNLGYALSVSKDAVIAVWLFNEGKGDTIKDSSGNGNDAAFGMGSPAWVDGKFGKALKFNGTKDWAETAKPVVVDTKTFTMGCWANPIAKQKAWSNMISSHIEPPRRGISFEQKDKKHNLYGLALGDGKNWGAPEEFGLQIEANQWNHMVVVRDGSTGYWYLNGKEVQKVKFPHDRAVHPTDKNFRFGNWVNGGREWGGILDDVFIFKRALSAGEVATVHKSGIGGTATPVDPKGKVSTYWSEIKSIY